MAVWANYGYCASHARWFWGLRLYLVCTPARMPVLWALADPKIGEREVRAAMLDAEPGLAASGITSRAATTAAVQRCRHNYSRCPAMSLRAGRELQQVSNDVVASRAGTTAEPDTGLITDEELTMAAQCGELRRRRRDPVRRPRPRRGSARRRCPGRPARPGQGEAGQ